MSTYAVVGGGISGLTVAYELRRLEPNARLVLFEASTRMGGKLHTLTREGIQVEAGADSFLARSPHAEDLCRAVGLADELVEPSVFGAVVRDGDALRRLPTGTVMGVPFHPREALRAEPLSPLGRLRATIGALDPLPLRGPDISVAAFVRSRFGKQVLERLVDPILAGTRAGDPNELSLAAALPQVDQRARRKSDAGTPAAPRFLAPRGGMSRLSDALVRSTPNLELRSDEPVRRIVRAGNVYSVDTALGGVEADGVIVATPSRVGATILRDLSAEVADALARQTYASVAVVTLVYRGEAPSVPEGTSGILVSGLRVGTLSAATWWSLKWPHTTIPDTFVARAFVGRAGRDRALELDDPRLVEVAGEELAEVLGRSPSDGWVTRWIDGLPQYELGHLARIDSLERNAAAFPAFAITGADLRGPGIPECIEQARRAAQRVCGEVRGGRG